jgi:hypothetical protein
VAYLALRLQKTRDKASEFLDGCRPTSNDSCHSGKP